MNDNLYNELSTEEKRIHDLYKSNENSFVYRLNTYLRFQQGHPFDFERNTCILDGIISRDRNDEELILYRATTYALIEPFIQNTIYVNPDFLSTAKDIASLENHFTYTIDPVFLQIYCSPNNRMISLETNELYASENEVLLGRNNNFQIHENIIINDVETIQCYMGRERSVGVNHLRVIKVSI